MKTHDFLLELGTEELPPKLLINLSNSLRDNLVEELKQLGIAIGKVSAFATPRRLAVSIFKIQSHQEDQLIEKKGPSVGSPEKAIEGFAKSCGVDLNSLEKRSLGGKKYYFFHAKELGQPIKDLLPSVVEKAIKNIPITRAMKWGELDYSFARPVHWLVMLLDDEVVPANIMGLVSGNTTKGLRSSDSSSLEIPHASEYQSFMREKAQIEVDFNKRKEIIREQVTSVAKKQ